MRLPKNNETPRETVVRHAGNLAIAVALSELEARCPDYVEAARWQQCIADGRRFLAEWGDKVLALGWDPDDLFGLHTPPAKPHPTYARLSRSDAMGLL